MYDIFALQESAQATGELRLGGRFDPPEFIETFETQTVSPGPFVSLKCVAKGDPAPEIEWFVYGQSVRDKEDGAIKTSTYQGQN
jgi:hypothetical protein